MVAIAIERIEDVIDRLTHDRSFRQKYCQDPDGTLAEYLTPAEIRAVKSGDGHLLGNVGKSLHWQEMSAGLCGADPGP